MIYPFRILFIIVMSFFILQGHAQQNENILITKEGDTIYILPIPKLEINSRLEEANAKLKKISELLVPHPQIAEIDSLVQFASGYINDHKEIIFEKEEFTIRAIDDFKREWLGYDKDISKWQKLVNDRISEIDKNLFDVKVTVNTWETTKQKSNELEVPDELVVKISDVIKYSKNIENRLKSKQDSIYIKQNILTEYQISVSEVIDYLDKKKESLQSDYFVRDSEYLWNTSDSTVRLKNMRSQISKSTDQNARSIRLFIESNSQKAYTHLLISILLIVLFYWLSREISKKELDENDHRIRDTKFFLSHYLASGFLIAIISAVFIYSNIPAAMREIVQLLLLIPTIFLIQGIYNKKLYPLIYTVVFLFLLDEIQVLVDQKSLVARLLLIFSNIVILWILFQFNLKKKLIRETFNLKWSRFALRLSNILILITVLSIIFNLVGYVNLALLISNTTIKILLSGIILIILLKVILSFFIGLFQTRNFQQLNIVRNDPQQLITKVHTILVYLSIFLWIRTILISLAIKDQTADWLNGLMDVEWKVGSGNISFGGIIGFSIAVVLTIYVTKFVKYILEDEIFPRVRLPRGVPGAISMMVRYVIVAFGIFVALSAAGLDLSKFGLIAGALGVGIGFGLQSIVFNFIAGLILAFERPIQKGDTIEVGTLLGDVTNIGVRASTVRTYDGSEVIVPNGNLISNDLTNWTLSDRKRRREVKIGVAYGTDPRAVMELISRVASEHPDVLPNPKPWPLFVGFGESSLDFRILFWASFDSGMTVQSEVAMQIYDAIAEAGIQIPFPQTDLHVKSFDPTIQNTVFPFASEQKKGSNKSKTKKPEEDKDL